MSLYGFYNHKKKSFSFWKNSGLAEGKRMATELILTEVPELKEASYRFGRERGGGVQARRDSKKVVAVQGNGTAHGVRQPRFKSHLYTDCLCDLS